MYFGTIPVPGTRAAQSLPPCVRRIRINADQIMGHYGSHSEVACSPLPASLLGFEVSRPRRALA